MGPMMNYMNNELQRGVTASTAELDRQQPRSESRVDAYFSADVETDGPIPGPFSMLSFALVFAGTYDGERFVRPTAYDRVFYRELKPISSDFQEEALSINGLDRTRLIEEGENPFEVMTEAFKWVQDNSGKASPVLVAYPLSFDWTWLYWYFVRFGKSGSPFGYSKCFDIKTALAVKSRAPISSSGRSQLPFDLTVNSPHTHHAIDDAVEQAEIFGNVFEWQGNRE
jgi:hypothetical protein